MMYSANNVKLIHLDLIDLSKVLVGPLVDRLYDDQYVVDFISSPPPDNGVYVGWARKYVRNLTFPDFIIVPEKMKEEFFSWSLSFIPQLVPLTSFIRVFDWPEWEWVTGSNKREVIDCFSLLSALVVGEVASDSANSEALSRMHLSAFDSSCSSVLAQVYGLGGGWRMMSQSASKWLEARSMTGMAPRVLGVSEILRIWSIVLHEEIPMLEEIKKEDITISSVFRSLKKGYVDASGLGLLLPEGRDAEEFFDSPSGDIESGIVRLEKLGVLLLNARIDLFVAGFLIGYGSCLIGSGRTRHLDYVKKWSKNFPTVVLWYMVCSSIIPKNYVLSERGFLCMRVGKKILEELKPLESPRGDVSLDELKVMIRNEGVQFPIRLISGGSMRVEVAPAVLAAVRPIGVEERQMELFSRNENIPKNDEASWVGGEQIATILESLKKEILRLQKALPQQEMKTSLRKKKN